MGATQNDGQMSKLSKSCKSVLYRVVQSKYFIPACLTAAFLVRICWICVVDAQPVSDCGWYYERAIDLSAGRGYSINGVPTAYWPVGYPAFLGFLFTAFGPSLFIAKISNIILYMGVLFFSYYIARKLFHSELTARITLLILSFYPNHIAYSSLLASEILFLFLLLLGLSLLMMTNHRFRLALGSGIIFGLACLVKPQAIFIPAIFFGTSLLASVKRKALRKYLTLLLIVYVSCIVTILPWTVRNYVAFDDFVFISTNSGINLLIGNNPYANGSYMYDDRVNALIEGAQGELERDVMARTSAIKYIAEHPLETVRLLPRKVFYLYGFDVEGIGWNISGISEIGSNMAKALRSFMYFAQFYYIAVVLLFLVSLCIFLNKKRKKTMSQPFPTLGLWIAFYFTFVYLLTFGSGRYHFPVIPWVIMYVGALAEMLLGRMSRNDNVSGEKQNGTENKKEAPSSSL